MRLQIGDYNTLKVLRILDYAYILGTDNENVFLHKKQSTKELDVNESVRVFLYYDNQKRITATMNEPLIDQEKAAFVDVVDINYKLGAFLDIGLQKDLLLSKDDLPFVKSEWPEKGDKVFAQMKTSKNQLTAKLINRYNIKQFLVPTEPLLEGQSYDAYNVYKAEEGNIFFTLEGHYIFVYFKHMRKDYRLGEKETVKITVEKADGSYNGIIIQQKERMIDEDAQSILDYLGEHGGSMPFTDKSSPDDIMREFHMSKGAFKRAIGSLYKSKLIDLDSSETRLLKS